MRIIINYFDSDKQRDIIMHLYTKFIQINRLDDDFNEILINGERFVTNKSIKIEE